MNLRRTLESSGNGSKLSVGILRWLGGIAAVLVTAAAIGGAGMLVETQSQLQALTQEVRGLGDKLDRYVAVQESRDARQDGQIERNGTHIRQIERGLWGGP